MAKALANLSNRAKLGGKREEKVSGNEYFMNGKDECEKRRCEIIASVAAHICCIISKVAVLQKHTLRTVLENANDKKMRKIYCVM